jgi:hypothetical protein
MSREEDAKTIHEALDILDSEGYFNAAWPAIDALKRLTVEPPASIVKESLAVQSATSEVDALDEKWLANWFAHKRREFNVQMGLQPLPRPSDPIPPSYFLANYMGREIKKLFDEHTAGLRARIAEGTK